MKILGALGIVMMLVFLWPRAKYMMQNSPKGSSSEWQTVALLLAGVAGFVALMMAAV